MADDPMVCLGRFRRHSCTGWSWENGRYYRECTLLGCSFSETTTDVHPVGATEIVGGVLRHAHEWTPWRTTADQFGLYLPPWGYRRTCSGCGAKQAAENVEATVD